MAEPIDTLKVICKSFTVELKEIQLWTGGMKGKVPFIHSRARHECYKFLYEYGWSIQRIADYFGTSWGAVQYGIHRVYERGM